MTDSFDNNDGGIATGIFEKDGLLYVAEGYSIDLYNVSDPYNIEQVVEYSGLEVGYTQDLVIGNDNVFVVKNGGLFIMKFTIMH